MSQWAHRCGNSLCQEIGDGLWTQESNSKQALPKGHVLDGTEEKLSLDQQGGRTRWDAIAMAMGGAGIPGWLHGMRVCSMQARPQHDRLDLYIMAVLLLLHGTRWEVRNLLVAAASTGQCHCSPVVCHSQAELPLKLSSYIKWLARCYWRRRGRGPGFTPGWKHQVVSSRRGTGMPVSWKKKI